MKLLILLMLLWPSIAYAEPSEVVLQTIAMESANQSEEGQYLVASVIVNRARNAGSSLEYQVSRRKQFSCWNDPSWAKAWLGRHYTQKARKQAKMALERAIMRPFNGVTHYHTTAIKPYWSKGHSPAVKDGQHLFYEGIA